MKAGDIVRRKQGREIGILFEIQKSYEVDPRVCRYKILWACAGWEWGCLDDIEVISERSDNF